VREPQRQPGLHKPLEFQLLALAAQRKAMPMLPPPPPPTIEKRLPSPARQVLRERVPRTAEKPAAAPHTEAAPEAAPEAPPAPARDLREVDLFPATVLRPLGAEGAAAGRGDDPLPSREAGSPDPSARLAAERVQGMLAAELARNRVQSGLIDPIWRDLEARTLDLFSPPEALVRSGQTAMTLRERLTNQTATIAKQILGSPFRVAPSTVPRGQDANRGPMGLPGSSNGSGMAAQQSHAVHEAWKQPASWRRTEVELLVTAAGEIERVRVISSCGVKKLDALAIEALEQATRQRLRNYTGKRTLTTWAIESAYAADIPVNAGADEIQPGLVTGGIGAGFSFDETGQARKNARGIRKYIGDMDYLGGGKVKTKVSLLSLRELAE
jgi:hypothetical protein